MNNTEKIDTTTALRIIFVVVIILLSFWVEGNMEILH